MRFFTWLAWRLPGNVETLVSINGNKYRHVRRTPFDWLWHRITR